MIEQSTIDFLKRWFNLPEGWTPPRWYHSGICYSRAAFDTKEAAEVFAEAVRKDGGTVNGGWYHGAPLGQLSGSDEHGWEVTC